LLERDYHNQDIVCHLDKEGNLQRNNIESCRKKKLMHRTFYPALVEYFLPR